MTDHNVQCGSGDPVPHTLANGFRHFAPVHRAQLGTSLVLVMGAILCPGKRTVTACLRITVRADAGNFSRYHQLVR
jgi:hypothetical protein